MEGNALSHTFVSECTFSPVSVMLKKRVVKRKLIANDSSDDEKVDEPQPSTSRITRKRRLSKQKKTQVATASSSPPPPDCDSRSKPPTASLTPSKFLSLLSDDEELSSLSEDDSKDECVDNESEGNASDSSEEQTQVSERELEDEEQGEATSVPLGATLAHLVWTDGHHFEPDIHNFDNPRSGVTDDWPCDDNTGEAECFRAFIDDIICIICNTYIVYNHIKIAHNDNI